MHARGQRVHPPAASIHPPANAVRADPHLIDYLSHRAECRVHQSPRINRLSFYGCPSVSLWLGHGRGPSSQSHEFPQRNIYAHASKLPSSPVASRHRPMFPFHAAHCKHRQAHYSYLACACGFLLRLMRGVFRSHAKPCSDKSSRGKVYILLCHNRSISATSG